MIPLIVFQGTGLKVSYYASSSKIVVFTFTPYSSSGKTSLHEPGFGVDFLLRQGIAVVEIIDAVNDWYSAFEDVIDEVNDFLNPLLSGKIRVGYGSSMGGYAAIKYSKRLGFERILAFSPQWSICDPFDTRWKGSIGKLSKPSRHPVSTGDVFDLCQYFVVSDTKGLDGFQIDNLARVIPRGQFNLIEVKYSGHPVGDFLKETGLLKGLTLSILVDGVQGGYDFRSKRSLSSSYCYALASECFKKGHLRFSLMLIDKALSLAKRVVYFRLRSNINKAMSLFDEAVSDLRQAELISAKDPFLYRDLALLYILRADFSNALSAINEALQLRDFVPGFFQLRVRYIWRLEGGIWRLVIIEML